MTDTHTETDYATADVYCKLGIAEALLDNVAEHMAPGPGGHFRVQLSPGTAQRIRDVVNGLRAELAMTTDDAQPIDAGDPGRWALSASEPF